MKDRLIAEIAAQQYGVVSRPQLVQAGIGAGAIHTRVVAGRLHRIHRGVYAVGHPVLAPFAREMAALLACGPGAAISHRTAARLWKLLDEDGDDIELTVAGRKTKTRAGLKVHSSRSLREADVRLLSALWVTVPVRTLVDLADVASDRDLERATARALTHRMVDPRRLLTEIASHQGRRGVARLRRLLDGSDPPAMTRSEAEERFLALIRAAELPPPRVNARLHGYEVDFHWPQQGVVVEVDGYQFHSSRDAFERDRRRDADLQSQGLSVLRVTWRQVVEEPYATVARTARALASR
jgi:very-short-patch-repair endonuclease